jgi:hypothetical protein
MADETQITAAAKSKLTERRKVLLVIVRGSIAGPILWFQKTIRHPDLDQDKSQPKGGDDYVRQFRSGLPADWTDSGGCRAVAPMEGAFSPP